MKYDLHCHTKEGSPDARLGVCEYAAMLKARGFSGMLITDHNSYRGYEYYQKRKYTDPEIAEKLAGFHVLRGVEYDTRDGGHVLVILPEGKDGRIFERMGLRLSELAALVHRSGGIIGAAHPYGTGYIAITNTKLYKRNPDIIRSFDFIEEFNSTLLPEKNEQARKLAAAYSKPVTSGSDSHSERLVGTAFTDFPVEIRNNNMLIREILAHDTVAGSAPFEGMAKRHNPIVRDVGIAGYWLYNKSGVLLLAAARKKALRGMTGVFYAAGENEKISDGSH